MCKMHAETGCVNTPLKQGNKENKRKKGKSFENQIERKREREKESAFNFVAGKF